PHPVDAPTSPTRLARAGGRAVTGPSEEEEMVQLLSPRARGARPADRRPPRLCLESLEARDTPTAITVDVVYGLGRNITLPGAVSDTAQPGGKMVVISGQASGTAVTDTSGNYAVTLGASGLGRVYAEVVEGGSGGGRNNMGNVSAEASVELTDMA